MIIFFSLLSIVWITDDPTKKTARVVIPWEMPEGTIKIGQNVPTTDMDGKTIGTGKIIAIKRSHWQNKRSLLSVEVPYSEADQIAGIQIQKTYQPQKPPKHYKPTDDQTIICRCERITKKEIKEYIKKTGTRDINAIKAALRVGMGPCGGKTCTDLIIQIFKEMGIKPKEIQPHTNRPFTQEIPLKAFLNKEEDT